MCDAVDSNGQWAWGMFQNFLSLSILVHIAATKPLLARDGNDETYWNHSKYGKFTIASAYSLIVEIVAKCFSKMESGVGLEWP